MVWESQPVQAAVGTRLWARSWAWMFQGRSPSWALWAGGSSRHSRLLKQVDSLASERMSQLLTVVRGGTLLEP